MLLRRVARPLLASAFVVDGVDTLMHPEQRVEVAGVLLRQAKDRSTEDIGAKLPDDPELVVRINAGAQVVGGVLLALGRAPRAAALVLAATVVPSALIEQDFWAEKDPERKAIKRNAFLKDVSLLGGLLIASADTEGKPSLGWRGRRAARRTAAAVSAAIPVGASSDTGEALTEQLHDTAIRAKALAGLAADKGAELAELARERGAEWAEIAKERGPEWAETARHRSAELAEVARDRGAELAELARERGAELAGMAKDRGPGWADALREKEAELAEAVREWEAELAELVRDRGPELAATARQRGTRLVESVRDGVETRVSRS
ncbi:DoxX family membrane protein [Nocardia sp. NPDC127526]|uniref:DoxX family membrane protein n=1 Tax=Nocardia sp. NPDC127526 TaxID=3345393 RepID=UPI003628B420